MTRREKAKELHEAGFNCAQSVLAAFCDVTGLTEQDALILGGGFGGGFGCGAVCGAACGAVMALGYLFPFCDTGDMEKKTLVKKAAQQFCRQFRETFGNLDCRDLLRSTAPERKCADYIDWSVMTVEQMLEELRETK